VRLFSGFPSAVRGLTFSADGRKLAARGIRGTVQVWERPGGRPTVLLKNESWVEDFGFDPDGRLLVIGAHRGAIQTWEQGEGFRMLPPELSQANGMLCKVHGPSRTLLAWTDLWFSRRPLRLFCWAPGENIRWRPSWNTDDPRIDALEPWWTAVSPDGTVLTALFREQASIKIFHVYLVDGCLAPNESRIPPLSDPEVVVMGIAVNGRTVAVALENAVYLSDWEGGHFQAMPEDSGVFRSIEFSPDGRLLAVGFVSGQVTLFDVDECRPITTYDWGIPDIQALAFAPDGLRLAAGGDGGQIIVWDLE
jgi:WD40 repeat protein